jgi:undecaprenyl diphosphate synthase
VKLARRLGRPAHPAAAAVTGAVAGPVPGGPRHVAIIMDGNGRWAKTRHLPRVAGHRAGVEAVRRVVEAAPDIGIGTLTLYAFSTENSRRPADEVSDLIGLLRYYIAAEIDALDANGVRLRVIGDWRSFSPDVVAQLQAAIDRTAGNTVMDLVIALNYGAQDELVRAVRGLAADVAAGRLAADAIDPALIDARLDTADLAPVDLIVRTSGEYRLSNFLLWQAAYAEFHFTDLLWPDFDAAALRDAAEAFARRDRRYGGL